MWILDFPNFIAVSRVFATVVPKQFLEKNLENRTVLASLGGQSCKSPCNLSPVFSADSWVVRRHGRAGAEQFLRFVRHLSL